MAQEPQKWFTHHWQKSVNQKMLFKKSNITFHYPVVLVQVFVNMGHKITFFAISKFTKHVCVMV